MDSAQSDKTAPAGYRAPTLTSNMSPPTFSGNSEDWIKFSRRFEWYRQASGLSDMPEQRQVSTFMYIMGENGDDLLTSFNMKGEKTTYTYKQVYERFHNYYTSRHNKIHARAKFNKLCQASEERIDDFITKVHSAAELCQYPENIKEELIRDRLIVGIKNTKISNDLQLDPEVSLATVLTKIRQSEEIEHQQSYVRSTASTSLEELNTVKRNFTNYRTINSETREGSHYNKCGKCGKSPSHAFSVCPAKSSSCTKCKKRGHWAQMCRTKKYIAEVNTDIQNSNGNEDSHYLGTINEYVDYIEENNDPWKVNLLIQNSNIKFKIDSGADVTVIGEKHYKMLENVSLQTTNAKLKGAAQGELRVLGKFSEEIIWKNKIIRSDIFVIKNLEEPLLGKPAIENLGIITRIDAISKPEIILESKDVYYVEDKLNVEEEYPQLFKGLGKLKGEYNICIKPNSKPYAITCPRRVAIPLYESLKKELKLLEDQNVIFPVDKPTDYCAGIVVRPKDNGDIRLCVDYTELNKNVQRSRHQLPSVDECLAQIGGANYFTKLDANKGYFQLPLNEESKLLTTFITPFGRYAFNRMPMGITCASEVFQKKMQSIIEGIHGTVCCQDDILITGKNVSEHNKRLRKVMSRLTEEGVTLNKSKCKFKVQECNFLGHIISNNGIKPCPKKIEAILNMPIPTDITTVRSLLGMVNYNLKFLPNLAVITKPIRDLLKNVKSDNNKLQWSETCDRAFNEIKRYLAKPKMLALFDPNKSIRVTADASSYGLGAVIEQFDTTNKIWRPISYASRSLTPTETNYAQIEKEAMALTWACERFRMYLIGLLFELRTDHKPLVALLGSKPITELTARMQRFRLRLTQFSYKIIHIPGKYIHTADVLSRSPLPTQLSEISETEEDKKVNLIINAQIKALPISDNLFKEIRESQENDDTCYLLSQYTLYGWPEKQNLDMDIQPFYTYRGELGMQKGVLMRGHRVLIPVKLQKEMLKRLHYGHLGVEKCRRRARESIWWPGISNRIKTLVEQCPECIQHRSNPTQPLIPSEIPKYPWEIVAIDLFSVKQKEYMVTVDYFSRFPEVSTLTSTSSLAIITHLKAVFARYGIPRVVRSDNGPQFDSNEFKKFSHDWGFSHITSSPHAHWANGMAEAGVKIVKNIILKSTEPILGLMAYRSSPLENGFSPAQLLFGRRIRTILPMSDNMLKPSWPNMSEVYKKKSESQFKTKVYYDKHHGSKEISDISCGTRVWDTILKRYAIVISKRSEPRSYNLRTDRGNIIRRNRRHLIIADGNDGSTDVQLNTEVNIPFEFECSSPRHDHVEESQVVKDDVATTRHNDTADCNNTPHAISGSSDSYAYITRYGRTVRKPDRLNL